MLQVGSLTAKKKAAPSGSGDTSKVMPYTPDMADDDRSGRNIDLVSILIDLTYYKSPPLVSAALGLLVRQFEQRKVLEQAARKVQLLVKPSMCKMYSSFDHLLSQLSALAERRRLYDDETYTAVVLMGQLTARCFEIPDEDDDEEEEAATRGGAGVQETPRDGDDDVRPFNASESGGSSKEESPRKMEEEPPPPPPYEEPKEEVNPAPAAALQAAEAAAEEELATEVLAEVLGGSPEPAPAPAEDAPPDPPPSPPPSPPSPPKSASTTSRLTRSKSMGRKSMATHLADHTTGMYLLCVGKAMVTLNSPKLTIKKLEPNCPPIGLSSRLQLFGRMYDVASHDGNEIVLKDPMALSTLKNAAHPPKFVAGEPEICRIFLEQHADGDPNPDFQLLLYNMNAHTIASKLLRLPINEVPNADELPVREVILGAYRLLKALCSGFKVSQNALLPMIPTIVTQTGYSLVANDITPTDCLVAILQDNPQGCLQIGDDLIRKFISLAASSKAPRFLRFLRNITGPERQPIIRSQTLVMQGIFDNPKAQLLFNGAEGKARARS